MAWTYIIGNGYYGDVFTTAWKYQNAWEFWQYFVSRGATEEATAGILGNITWEGEMNPGQIQHNTDPNNPSSGRGLIGWTPGTKIINYANSVGGDWYDGDIQCEYIFYHPEGYQGQTNFFPNYSAGYSYSWSEFLQITDVATAALAWLFEAERPADQGQAQQDRRKNSAQGWYDEFHGQVTPPPTPVDPPSPDTPPSPDIPQPPGSMDMFLLGGRDVMRRLWFKK